MKVLKMNGLTPMQEGMLFHSLLAEQGLNYHTQICYYIEGNIRIDLFKAAWQEVIKRHEIFRSDFIWKRAKEPVQVVLDHKDAYFLEKDWRHLPAGEQEQLVNQLKAEELHHQFDFEKGLLNRVSILQLSETRYFVGWTFHHILLDGWSLPLVLNDHFQIYNCLLKGTNLPPEPRAQFSDYLDWLKVQDKAGGLEYWKKYLQEFVRPTLIPYDQRPGENEVINDPVNTEFALDIQATAKLQSFCQKHSITVNAFVQTAWGILLQRYNYTGLSCFGSAVSGRPADLANVEEIVGLLINTVPVVVETAEGDSVKALLSKVNAGLVTSRKYDYVPLAEIQRLSCRPKENLFNSIIIFENYPIDKAVQESGFDFKITPDAAFELDNYDFSISASINERLLIKFVYNGKLFKAETVARVQQNFEHLLYTMMQNPDTLVDDLEIVAPKEREVLLTEFNSTGADFPEERPVHSLFEERVQKNADKVAAVFNGRKLTYLELNSRANQLAHQLREWGVRSGNIVGIMVEPSFDMLIALFAVLKAGGAYLPVDPGYPAKRIEYILQDSNTQILLTKSQLQHKAEFGGRTVLLEDESASASEISNPLVNTTSRDLAYLIYTSGSTGQPKGVMIEHRSLVNLVQWHNKFYGVTPADRLTKYASFSFDASVWEIFPALIAGAELHILPEEIRLDVQELNSYYEKHGITISFLPTPVCEKFVDLENHSLRFIQTAGDKLNYWREHNYRVVNNYGPTEDTVCTTCHVVEQWRENIPIGKPIYNNQVYILNRNQKLQPVGAAGELCIAGDGLARGYWNREELTAQKFVANPFKAGSQMYRTGDLARMLPDGNIEFLGRIDQQIKIRGFRIETGEIETQLLKHPEIKEAIVLAREDANAGKYLAAYFTGSPELVVSSLREYLLSILPDYMIPSYFIRLEQFPLTANGKVDRDAFPEPGENQTSGKPYIAPRNDVEARIARIFASLLKVEKVGVDDNFFDLGAHSLKATQLASRLSKEFTQQISLRKVFDRPTVAKLAQLIGGEVSPYSSIKPAEQREYYPVSAAQKRLYALNQLDGDSTNYNVSGMMTIGGDFDLRRFEVAFEELILRHESLRTSFALVDGEVVQLVHPKVLFQVQYLEAGEQELRQICTEFLRPFDLKQAPLLRVGVVKTEGYHLLMLDMHHIIADGASLETLFSELSQLYAGKDLEPVKLQYKDYAVWQKEVFNPQVIGTQERFWLEAFAGEIPLLNLPTDYPRPAVKDFRGDMYGFAISRELTTQLNELAKTKGATLYMVLLAAFQVLLARYSAQEEIIVGSPIAGRPHADLEKIVGMFVNTLAMRSYPVQSKSFTSYLDEVKEGALNAYQHQDYQFDMLVEKLDLARDLSRNPLFDVMFVLQNANEITFTMGDLHITPYHFDYQVAKFDLLLNAQEHDGIIHFAFEYSTSLFKRETVVSFANHLLNLLASITAGPEKLLMDLEMLSPEEREEVLVQFNQTARAFPEDQHLQQILERRVLEQPDRIALVDNEGTLTYCELNARVNQLAARLRSLGVAPDQIVAVMAERSFEMVIGILAIVKAGGAYLPVDPDYPLERIRFIVQDSGARILLTQSHLRPRLDFLDTVVDIDDPEIYQAEVPDLPMLRGFGDLLYVIYTSGSMGQPKGVMVEEASVVNILTALEQDYPLGADDAYLLKTNYTFDVSVTELFGWFMGSGRLVILKPGADKDPEAIIQTIVAEQVTHINFVPSMLQILLRTLPAEKIAILQKLKYLFVAGEAISRELVERFIRLVPGVIFDNIYGPTESTIYATRYPLAELESEDGGLTNVPIGKPLAHIKVYVLDQYGKLLPVGVPGELCIAGKSLARGYLHRQELTAEKFVSNPYEPGTRMYKTGDLVRWLPNGKIEYIGRIDQQVKIRGFRIELGEIENRLLQHEAVKEAVVIDKVDSGQAKYLVSYLVTNREVSVAGLRAALLQKLPEYMVPQYFVLLEKMPLNSNGKIDRKALAASGEKLTGQKEYVAPVLPEECQLAAIWQEILGVERVSVTDNFFELGGDSIKAIQILARANQMGLSLTVKDIFKHRTIANLMQQLDLSAVKKAGSREEVTGTVLLTPIQQWFFEQKLLYPHYWNQSNLFAVPENVDIELLEKVLQAVVSHHDALRTRFQQNGSVVEQSIRGSAEVEFKLQVIDLSNEREQAEQILHWSKEIQNALDLSTDLLFKAVLFDLGRSGKRLWLVAHHLIIDGVSWRILLEDIETLYQSGLSRELPFKSTSIKEWSQHLAEWAKADGPDTEYWEQLAQHKLVSIDQNPQCVNHFGALKTCQIELTESETAHLLSRVNRAFNTGITDILLAAFTLAFTGETGTQNLVLSLEGHGREEILPGQDLSRTVGWFTAAYPVCFERQDSLARMIAHVKEVLRRIPDKGVHYGVGRYLGNNSSLAKLHPEISFNYLGDFSETLQSGLSSEERLLGECKERSAEPLHSGNHHPYLIDVNGMIFNGKLTLMISYHPEKVTVALIKRLSELYREKLGEIIHYCVELQKPVPTPSDFQLEKVLDLKDFAVLREMVDLDQVQVYPVTPMQEGMLFYHKLNETGRNFYQQLCFYLEGTLDVELLKKSWHLVTGRHQIFRTAFITNELKTPVQVVRSSVEPEIQSMDWSAQSGHAELIRQFKEQDLQIPFDFLQGKLNRFSIVKLAQDQHFICWTFHHILLDGWSLQLVLSDLFMIYHQLKQGQPLPAASGAQFGDYLLWLQNWNRRVANKFWKRYFAGFTRPTLLPYDGKGKKGEVISKYCATEFYLDAEQTQRVTEFCRRHNLTMNALIETVWGVVLQKYNYTTQSCFGTTVAGRPAELKNVESIAGLFINALPVIVETSGTDTLFTLAQKVNDQLVEIRGYEFVSLAEIQKLSGYSGELFDSIVVYQNYPINPVPATSELGFAIRFDSVFDLGNYDFALIVASQEKMAFRISYNPDLFTERRISWIYENIVQLLNAFLTAPGSLVQEVVLTGSEEKAYLLETLNDTDRPAAHCQALHQLFEEQVERTPEQIALNCAGKVVTYQELNDRANQLARALQARGLQPDQLVGIMLERSVEMALAILGVLKAGCAYLPVDPAYPVDRIHYMLTDGQLKLLLTRPEHVSALSVPGLEILDTGDAGLYTGDRQNLTWHGQPGNLAYVIYTSGSTGQPKGVMVEHRNIVNTLSWRKDEYELGTADRVLQLFSCAFDGFLTSFFSPLVSGATVVFLNEEEAKDPLAMKKAIVKEAITHCIAVPSLYMAVVESLQPGEASSLKKVTLAGEEVTHRLISLSKQILPEVELSNEYGPTENAVATTCQRNLTEDSPFIGRPIANTRVYLLDEAMHPVPFGAPGEICVAGAGVARGYLNKPALTADKFRSNPFRPEERLYRTGDLGSWSGEGQLRFHGRIDQQVKIRGYRIEPGEIEKVLLYHHAVKAGVVTVYENSSGEKELCAYYVSTEALTVGELHEHLNRVLPSYMVPAHFVRLEELPLNANGKVDLKALPALEGNAGTGVSYAAPRNAGEEQMVRVWSDLLNKQQISITDNFFELGGHSLKAKQLVTRIYKEFNIEIPLRQIFKHPTIEGLCEYLMQQQKIDFSTIKPAAPAQYYPVSSAQKRIFALRKMYGDTTVYNIPGALLIKGNLERERFAAALEALIHRHESLRTSFTMINDEIVQQVHDQVDFTLEVYQGTEEEAAGLIASFIRSFDLQKAPLFRAALIELGEKHVFVWDWHHIIADGVSASIFLENLLRLYEGETLEPLRIQYKDFAVWQNQLFSSPKIKAEEEYWTKTLSGTLPVLNLPLDYPRPAVASFAGDQYGLTLNSELVSGIQKLAAETGTTVYMILLAVLNIFLAKCSGQEDIITGSPVDGRPHADLEQIVGMFVNTVPVRNYPRAGLSFLQFLTGVKENTLKAFENQNYQFDMMLDKLELKRDVSRNPLFDVMLTVQNADGKPVTCKEIELEPYPAGMSVAKFDLLITAVSGPDQLYLGFEYCTRLFKRETITRWASYFAQILKNVISEPEIELSAIKMSTPEDEQLLEQWNDTLTNYPKHLTLQQIFEEQVERAPQAIALVFGEEQLTYQELNTRANQLAHLLWEKGVGREQIVALFVERSMEMIIGILAILKAGGTYLPVEVNYPGARIAYMLEDSNARLLLTQKSLKDRLSFSGEIIELDNPQIYSGSGNNLKPVTKSDDLAYVLYTSGTTGKPKGVLTRHYSVTRVVVETNYLQLTAADRVLQLSNYAFDGSTFDIYAALLNGGALVLVEPEVLKDINKLTELIKKQQITVFFATAALFNAIVDLDVTCLHSIRKVLFGGESGSVAHVRKAWQYLGNDRIINGYGPTESTVFAASYTVNDFDLKAQTVPIGRPLANTQIYIVDQGYRLQPVGIPGELCIAGDGLARGFLNRPELMQDKFIAHPWKSGELLYRSGDLARWLPDGNIEFLGRLDQQIKLRGYRIELGEIESRLLEHPALQQAVVILREDHSGSKYLTAYIVRSRDVGEVELRAFIAETLPEYMIPSHFVFLRELPLNLNGKIDRNALPEPARESSEQVYHGPRNAIDQQLLEIFAEVLGSTQAGIDDNFFDLGGNSISALKVLARARACGFNIAAQDIFERPAVRLLADQLSGVAELPAAEEESLALIAQIPAVEQEVAAAVEEARAKDILLTGATGFLGAHLLQELLRVTDKRIHCLIRAESKVEAENRLGQIWEFYFAERLDSFRERLVLHAGDLASKQFGLAPEEYSRLGREVGTVLNAAALVKHFGNYRDFERINVQGTAEVIEFALLAGANLHHISTMSVAGDLISGAGSKKFTETDYYIGQNYADNVYVKSKFIAENLLYKAGAAGLSWTVHRVGNLAGRYVDGKFQKNIADNNFYNFIKTTVDLGIVSRETLALSLEFTPVDICSKAIVTALYRPDVRGRVFHMYNHRTGTINVLVQVLEEEGYALEVIEQADYQARIHAIITDRSEAERLMRVTAYQVAVESGERTAKVQISSEATVEYLAQCGFTWPEIDLPYMQRVLAYMRAVKFI